MKHFNVIFEPDGRQISIHPGASLVEAAGQAGIILNTVCGGKGICRKCRLVLEPQGEDILACQYRVQSDVTVTIPRTSRFFEQKILKHGIYKQIKVLPTVCKRYLKIDSPELEMLKAGLDKGLPNQVTQITAKVAQQLRGLDWQTLSEGLTVVCHLDPASHSRDSTVGKYTAVSLEPGDTTGRIFGVAVDIGTTTVVAKLIDMADGKCRAIRAAVNPQSRYGDDVISRISYAQSDAKLAELHKVIIECINQLIGGLCKSAAVDANHIYEMCAVGNTTMNHLFLKLPVRQLGQAPYKAFCVDAKDVAAEQMEVRINRAGNIHTVENIAGFVGSDTTAVALAVDIGSAEEWTLAVDIGTNGELVLGAGDRLYAASCAAGPALEGARITCGSRAVEGAIEAVVVDDGDVGVDVIGNCAARSICGSGLVDGVAVLLDLGVVDSSGRFVERRKLENFLPSSVLSRLIELDGQPAFVVAENRDVCPPGVVLTQKDIRQVQLAKAAIRAGIRLLQKRTGIEDADIERILVAGAFGNYIRAESAVRIGLLPGVPLERIHFVGNAASSGARMILLSRQCRVKARELARRIEYVEIAHEAEFMTVYADCMSF